MIRRGYFAATLPYPPSVNHLWRIGSHGGIIVSAEGKRFRAAIAAALLAMQAPKLEGRLRLTLMFYPPDMRRRDIDNPLKALLDALKHGGLFSDDSQIKALNVTMFDLMPVRLGKTVLACGEITDG